MSEIWNKVYSSDASFFGDVPSNFGLNCHEEFKKHVVKKLLELGCGQGRDTTFFASNGIDVVAIDCSRVAIDALSKITREKNLRIKPMIHNASEGILFNGSYFDVLYSHMFFNMRFTDDQLSTFLLKSTEFSRMEDLICFLSEVRMMQCTKKVQKSKKIYSI